MTIEALPAATPPKEASFDKLLSHDDVQMQNLPQTSTTQGQEQPTRVQVRLNVVEVALESGYCLVWVIACGLKKVSNWIKALQALENTSILLALVLFLQLMKV